MNISVAWKAGRRGGDLLFFGSGESHGDFRGGCALPNEGWKPCQGVRSTREWIREAPVARAASCPTC